MRITRFIQIIIVTAFLSACASKTVFKTSKVVPAAEGEVRVKELKNGNYSIDVSVMNLASPEKLSPSREVYVVWNVGKEGKYNIGRLSMDEEMNGKLSTESPYEVVKIYISAENDSQVSKPGKIVLKSKKL